MRFRWVRHASKVAARIFLSLGLVIHLVQCAQISPLELLRQHFSGTFCPRKRSAKRFKNQKDQGVCILPWSNARGLSHECSVG